MGTCRLSDDGTLDIADAAACCAVGAVVGCALMAFPDAAGCTEAAPRLDRGT
jgi:hypothetical protein